MCDGVASLFEQSLSELSRSLQGFKVLLVRAKLNHSFNNVNPGLKKMRPQYIKPHTPIYTGTHKTCQAFRACLLCPQTGSKFPIFTTESFPTSRFEIPRTKNLIILQSNKLAARATPVAWSQLFAGR